MTDLKQLNEELKHFDDELLMIYYVVGPSQGVRVLGSFLSLPHFLDFLFHCRNYGQYIPVFNMVVIRESQTITYIDSIKQAFY